MLAIVPETKHCTEMPSFTACDKDCVAIKIDYTIYPPQSHACQIQQLRVSLSRFIRRNLFVESN